MANEKDPKENNPSPAASSKKSDLVTEIGTLTYPRAVEHFGKERAFEVMKKVAEIGGHGLFTEDDFTSPLFGGLGMPNPDQVIKARREDFVGPEAEFYFQAALEDYEVLKEQATANRVAINDYYLSLK